MWIPFERQAKRCEIVSIPRIVRRACSIVTSVVILFSGTTFAEEAKSLLLDVALESPAGGMYQLKLRVTNTSSEPITIYDTDLPWITPNQLVFVSRAYRTNARRTLLPKFTPMEDYARISNELAPGQSLEDVIDLNIMFPTLTEITGKSNVRVEWVCRSKRLTFRCKEGRGGNFVITKHEPRSSGTVRSPHPSPSIPQTK